MGTQIRLRTRRFCLTLGLFGVLAVGFSSIQVTAQGQRGGGMAGFGGQTGGSYYLERDLPFFVQQLGLDSPQRLVLEFALNDYLAAHRQASEDMREQFQAMRPERTEEDREAQRAIRENMRAVGQELRQVAQAMRELQERIEQSGQRNDRADRMMAQLEQRMNALRVEMEAAGAGAMNQGGWQQNIDQMAGVFEAYRNQTRRIEEQFEADVKALLDDQQFARWEKFEQFMRRQKTLPMGRLSGERIDLFNIVRDLRIDVDNQERDVQPLLDEYARQLDSALKRRNDAIEEATNQMRELLQNQNVDRALALAREEAAVRSRVRDVNRTFAELIAGSMVDRELADEFTKKFNEQAYTQVYRPTLTQRAFEAAKEFEDLTDDVRNAILSLEQTHRVELQSQNQALNRVLIDQEPRDIVTRMEQMAARFSRERFSAPESPTREAFERRSSMEQMYRNLLENLLTPEQVAELPQERRGRGGGANAGQLQRGGDGQRGARGQQGGGDADARGGRRGGRGGDDN